MASLNLLTVEKACLNIASEIAQDRPAWAVSIRDAANRPSLPHLRSDTGDHRYKVLLRPSRGERKRLSFSARVVKYWNKLPTSIATPPLVHIV